MFKKATKEQAKLRAAIYAPAGGGKTRTLLRIATGIAKATGARIALIDSEHGSASKYADLFDFDAHNLTGKSVDDYLEAIEGAKKAGYGVLGIDSLSHAWVDLVQATDEVAAASNSKSTFNAWKKTAPKQQELIEAILAYPGHVICTMRSKTEWAQYEEGGKKKIERLGLAPVQGKGIEYEFDLLLAMNAGHWATVEKDRSGKFQGKQIEKPGEEFGQELAAWLGQGAPVKTTAEKLSEALGEHEASVNAFFLKVGWIKDKQTFRDLAEDKAAQVLSRPADVIAKANQ